MIINLVQLGGGLILLLIGGRLLVNASVDTARRLHVSPLLIGLTLVAWGTSAPEFALNVISAAKGHGDLAIGNVIGANICNLSLVLGVCALIRPLVVDERIIRVEIWVHAAVLLLFAASGLAGRLGRWDGALLLAIFGVYSTFTIVAARRESAQGSAAIKISEDEIPTHERGPMSVLLIAISFIAGLILLTAGGSTASDGATSIAIALGVPAAIVGVTIVSVGTTLPEFATSVIATRRGSADLAVGNLIGSCLFNCGAVFGVAALIGTPPVDDSLTLPLAFMGLLALVLIPISRTHGRTVSRVEGGGLLASYVTFLVISAFMVL